MEKIYNKTQWENTPSTNTPINETNLNNIENGVDALDDRVVELSNTKSNVDWVQLQTSGDKIAEITIDGVKRTVYAKSGSGGGGGGTSDYNALDNRPQINGVTLSGNKSTADLGIVIPTALNQLTDDVTHRLVTDSEKTAWNNKSDFDGNYNSLSNKPTIPSALSELTEDATHRTVTDEEKAKWNQGGGGSSSASDITYDNSTSGMTATNVQDAIDEQKQDLTQLETYSYDDVVIGTFLDKPLYRKVVVETQTREASQTNTWVDCQSVNIPIKYLTRTVVTYNVGGETIMLPSYFTFRYDVANHKLVALNTRGSGAQIPAGSLYILEYTKTTD